MTFSKIGMIVDSATFRSKDGRSFHKVDLVDLQKSTGAGRCITAFIDDLPDYVKNFNVGDMVKFTWELPDLQSKPKLIGIGEKPVAQTTFAPEFGKEM